MYVCLHDIIAFRAFRDNLSINFFEDSLGQFSLQKNLFIQVDCSAIYNVFLFFPYIHTKTAF